MKNSQEDVEISRKLKEVLPKDLQNQAKQILNIFEQSKMTKKDIFAFQLFCESFALKVAKLLEADKGNINKK